MVCWPAGKDVSGANLMKKLLGARIMLLTLGRAGPMIRERRGLAASAATGIMADLYPPHDQHVNFAASTGVTNVTGCLLYFLDGYGDDRRPRCRYEAACCSIPAPRASLPIRREA